MTLVPEYNFNMYPFAIVLTTSIMFQAFQDLSSGPVPRLEPQNTDVEPYVVDGVVYLARL